MKNNELEAAARQAEVELLWILQETRRADDKPPSYIPKPLVNQILRCEKEITLCIGEVRLAEHAENKALIIELRRKFIRLHKNLRRLYFETGLVDETDFQRNDQGA